MEVTWGNRIRRIRRFLPIPTDTVLPAMWSNPGVRRLLLARLVSRIGGEAAFFVGIWGKAAFEFEASPGELAVVMGALGVAALIGASVAGVLIDRFGPRKVVVGGEILFIPAALSFILVSTIPQLALATFALGLVGTPVFTAIASFAPFLTEDETELNQINSYLEGVSWAGFVLGPAAGAALVTTIGLDSIFVLDAVTSAIGALIILPVSTRDLSSGQRKKGGISELVEGFRYTYSHPRLRFYIWLGSSVWLLFGTFGALEPLFFRDVLETEVDALGWVNTMFGVGLIGGSITASRLPSRFRTATFLTLVVGLNAVGVLAYVGTDNLRVVFVAGVFWGFIIGVMAPLHRTMLQINSPEPMVGRIMGVSHIHSEGGHLIPLAIAPTLAAILGVQLALISAGLVVAVIAALFMLPARRLDRTRDSAVPAPGLPDPAEEPKALGT